MSNELESTAKNVSSIEEFETFLTQLIESLSIEPQLWNNANLDPFLDGLRSYISRLEEMDLSKFNELNANRKYWSLFAEMLMEARKYE